MSASSARKLQRARASLNRGRVDEARGLCEEILERAPRNPDALCLLGLTHVASGDGAAALPCFESVLRADPRHGEALEHAGLAFLMLGRTADAERTLRAASALPRAPGSVFMRLGVALLRLVRPGEAAAALEHAVRLAPDDVDSRLNLGRAYVQFGDFAKAREAFEHVLRRYPDHLDSLFNMGALCLEQDRLDEAERWFERVIAGEPRLAEAHVSLGIVLQRRGELVRAAGHFRRAIDLDPRLAEAHFNLGQALHAEGRMAAAAGCFRAVLEIAPGHAGARWALALAQIPAIYETESEIGRSRSAYAAALDDLEGWLRSQRPAAAFSGVGVLQPFLLAYQQENNRELMRRYGALCVDAMSEWRAGQQLPLPATRRPDGVLRIGIVSQHFRKHSVWEAILKGWFERLDRSRFSLHAFYVGSHHDDETRFAVERAATFTEGPLSPGAWARAILSQEIDVLIYPEIGMDPLTVQLASLRLARVQAVSWGHPETSGLPTIDYYLSAEDLEPQGAEHNYSERLIRLPGLGCCYERARVTPAAVDLAGWALDGDAPRFVCAGTPFKYGPAYDRVLVEIAQRVGECRFIFFSHPLAHLTERLRERLSEAFRAAGLNAATHLRFVPWLDTARFRGLLECCEVYLDTMGFSGFNTALHAVEAGLPIATHDAAFMRGRLGAGLLRRMGLADLIATTHAEYVELAVRLASDPAYRAAVRERIERSRDVLFEDLEPVRALEAFLTQAARDAGT